MDEIEVTKGIENPTKNQENGTNVPDIYYIILDGYARGDFLKKELKFDNKHFYDYLTDKGFVCGRKKALAIMLQHLYTLAIPSLNMEYLKLL